MPNQVTGVGLSENSLIALVGQDVGSENNAAACSPFAPADAPSTPCLLRALRN